jgi:hypothetical protein
MLNKHKHKRNIEDHRVGVKIKCKLQAFCHLIKSYMFKKSAPLLWVDYKLSSIKLTR